MTTTNLGSLWPAQIRSRVQSPWAILRLQADALSQQTGGMLLGEVKPLTAPQDKVAWGFSIVAPALRNFRHRIMTVAHAQGMGYPVVVDAEIFRPESASEYLRFLEAESRPLIRDDPYEVKPRSRADSEEEFVALVSAVFNSPYVLSAAQSFIARSGEVLAAGESDAKGEEPGSASAASEQDSPS